MVEDHVGEKWTLAQASRCTLLFSRHFVEPKSTAETRSVWGIPSERFLLFGGSPHVLVSPNQPRSSHTRRGSLPASQPINFSQVPHSLCVAS